MKKLLLSATLAVTAALGAFAGTVTDVLTVKSLPGVDATSTSTSYAEFTVTGESGAEYALQCAHNKGTVLQFRSSNNNSGLVVTKSAGTVSKVTLTWNSSTASGRTVSVYTSKTAYTAPSGLYSGTAAGEIVIPNTTFDVADAPYIGIRSKSGALYLDKIEITWETPGDVQTTAAPKFELVEGEYGFEVTITAEDGADIYYTTDGTDPTAESTKYTAPIEVWAGEEWNIKAIAVKDGIASRVVTYSPNVPFLLEDFSPLSDYTADMIPAAGLPIIVKGTMTAIYQSGSYLYLHAGYSNACIYGTQAGKYENGDTFTRLQGTFVYYNGLPEIKDAVLTAGDKGTPVQPSEVELETLGQNMLLQYVKVTDVEISGVSGKNATVKQGDASMALYNNFSLSEIPTGTGFTITGFVGIFNTTLQLQPTEITGGSEVKTVATPIINPEEGEYVAGTLISITCATAGASIYYTIDETTPSATNGTLYAEPFALDDDMIVKAIAILEGYDDSEIAESWFFIKEGGDTPDDPNPGDHILVEFDFTAPADLTFATPITLPSKGNGTNLDGNSITSNGVTISFAKGTNTSNDVRIFYSTQGDGGYDLRTYAGNAVTVSVPASHFINKMEIVANATPSVDKGTITNGVWTPGEAATSRAAAINSVVLGGKVNYTKLVVEAHKIGTGIEAVEADAAEALYYNLQGVRVANPATGIYIRVAGGKATKVRM